MVNFALLSVRNHPILNSLLKELEEINCKPKCIIFDQKNLTKEEIDRYCERTGKNLYDIDFFKNSEFKFSKFDVKNHNDDNTIKLVQDLDLDFLINAGTPRILKEKIIISTRLGVLNCHPGILPYFKGCSCVEWSIFNDKPIGNTIHWMDEGIDTGPIIKTQKTKCFNSDTYQDIRNRVYKDGQKLIAVFVKEFNNYSLHNKLEINKTQVKGTYFKPMKEEFLKKVINKIKTKNYIYQIDR